MPKLQELSVDGAKSLLFRGLALDGWYLRYMPRKREGITYAYGVELWNERGLVVAQTASGLNGELAEALNFTLSALASRAISESKSVPMGRLRPTRVFWFTVDWPNWAAETTHARIRIPMQHDSASAGSQCLEVSEVLL